VVQFQTVIDLDMPAMLQNPKLIDLYVRGLRCRMRCWRAANRARLLQNKAGRRAAG
jgi:hypothetical protein